VFFVPVGEDFEIRWFTPLVEVDLCGHATLASAHLLFNEMGYLNKKINFDSPRSGMLTVTRENDLLALNFPSDDIQICDLLPELASSMNILPQEVYKGKTDYMLIYHNEEEIRQICPNFYKLSHIKARGFIVTAKGNEVDFVSRFFGTGVGVNEDPVTGSAHTTLTPYWSSRLNKKILTAKQLSPRGGFLICENLNDRVSIKGKSITYLEGTITV